MNLGPYISFYAVVLFFCINCLSFVNSTTPLIANVNAQDVASIDKEIAATLIRDTAEKEREDIRTTIETTLTNYNPFKIRNLQLTNIHFTRWETMAETSRQRQALHDLNDRKLLVKISEGVWKGDDTGGQSNLKENERITVKELTGQFQQSEFVIVRETYSGPVFLYTSKTAYYRFQHESRVQFYNTTMESFIKKIEEVNAWEKDMLSALDLNYGTTPVTLVPQMIGNLMKTWENKVVNNLKRENECDDKMVCPEKSHISTTETLKDGEKNSKDKEQKTKDQNPNDKDVSGNGKKHDEEIAVFLSLYDKHGHLLETILAQRELKKA